MSELRHSETQWLAVRCCCGPTKILGFLSVPSQHVGRGAPIMFRMTMGRACTAEVRRLSDCRNGAFQDEWAIYSEDRPLSFWRDVEGFVEAGSAYDNRFVDYGESMNFLSGPDR